MLNPNTTNPNQPIEKKRKKYNYVDLTDPRQNTKTIINLKVKCNEKQKKTKWWRRLSRGKRAPYPLSQRGELLRTLQN